MGKKEFKDLPEAVAHIAKQDEAITKLAKEKAEAIAEAKEAKEIAKNAVAQAKEAEEFAKDAVAAANASMAAVKSNDVTVKVGGATYKVAFGVDGLSKAELAKDTDKCAKLIKKGTAALVKVEG